MVGIKHLRQAHHLAQPGKGRGGGEGGLREAQRHAKEDGKKDERAGGPDHISICNFDTLSTGTK